MRVVVSIAATMILLAGCAGGPPTKPDGSAISIADAGAPPDRAHVIRSYLRSSLKDPASAQIEGELGPVFIKQAAGIGGPATYGWGICFQVNAKNSYGAYVGFSTMSLIWRDGVVQRAYGGTHWLEQAQATAICDVIRRAA